MSADQSVKQQGVKAILCPHHAAAMHSYNTAETDKPTAYQHHVCEHMGPTKEIKYAVAEVSAADAAALYSYLRSRAVLKAVSFKRDAATRQTLAIYAQQDEEKQDSKEDCQANRSAHSCTAIRLCDC